MQFRLSKFGQKLGGPCGIQELMDDLGTALTTEPGMRMLGGGNPAHIPQMQAVWRARMRELLEDSGAYDRMLANYDPPRGNPAFVEALASCLHHTCGWNITPQHIAVTPGGQAAWFMLFNMLAGEQLDGRHRKILLPLVPEYIGYENQGLDEGFFAACHPSIEKLPGNEFKYHVDFPAVEAALDDSIAALCVSRPTNPSGNVLTDAEVAQLASLAGSRGVPLLLDNAYGLPFPGAIYTPAQPVWNEDIILTLSLSKLGLPGTRTGIVIARPEIAQAVQSMTSVIGLANTNVGQALVLPLLRSGELMRLSREVIRPFYEERARRALAWVRESFAGLNWAVHRAEGAFFLWLHFPGLPIATRELYQRLKRRKVLIVPGEYFFFGTERDWAHGRECIRMTFSQREEIVREGIAIIADEVRSL
jgi:valine--pyruvate aminotransferase